MNCLHKCEGCAGKKKQFGKVFSDSDDAVKKEQFQSNILVKVGLFGSVGLLNPLFVLH